ncbi:MAG: DNA-processing protein DprA [Desulfobacterales bacterium]|nr:DNA-processing protein DprA [Desulfobacterales bacterium]
MENLLHWFKLKSINGIGNLLFKRLLDKFQTPGQVFEADRNDLLEVDGISQRIVSLIKKNNLPDSYKREMDIISKKKYQVITYNDAAYPPLLKEIPDPPPYLYVLGNLEANTHKIAIVGSRNATRYGLDAAGHLGFGLASLDITVVSGMARGIDTSAHTGAITAMGKTIAVLGTGLERIYPAENRKLYYKIAENGAVVSEFPLMAEPDPHHFPARNRIISGLSLGTVVVEATKKSGSLITARLAAEQNREVFAVPGSINSFKSFGAHSLIKAGAKLVVSVGDIIEEFPFLQHQKIKDSTVKTDADLADLSSDERIVFDALGPYPVHIDELIRTSGHGAGLLSSILLRLELKGLINQQPGKLFVRA